ncbi:MAG: hypothetical protein ACLFQI_08265 [Halochromatium sp.]|uniref:hypothetical protein n=1 Tax=Halochromatium sp. TaxID=2049430 RepID=UPI0039793F94
MDEDPKRAAVRFYLIDEGWLELGCILFFSQYHDSARWISVNRLNIADSAALL